MLWEEILYTEPSFPLSTMFCFCWIFTLEALTPNFRVFRVSWELPYWVLMVQITAVLELPSRLL